MDMVVPVQRPRSQTESKLRTSFAIRAFEKLRDDLRLRRIPVDKLASDFEVVRVLSEASSCRGVNIAEICPIREWGAFCIQRDFSHSRFENMEFRRTDLSGSVFLGAKFCNISASKLALNRIDARYTVWLGSDILESSIRSASFVRADLSGCDLSGCDLSNSSFRNIRAVGTSFRGARLHNCDFSFSHLKDAKFSEALLQNTDFSYALDISHEYLPPVKFGQANFWGVTVTNGFNPRDWPRKVPSPRKLFLALLRSARLWGCFETAAAP